MNIGKLAADTNMPVETIRYYERSGLMPAPARSTGNYRVYTPAHAERLAFIRQCRGLDMSLDEIRRLLGFVDTPETACAAVNALLDEHIGHVSQRIDELHHLDRQLRMLRERCENVGDSASCGILSGLTAPAIDSTAGGPASAHIGGAHTHRKASD